ncbi:nucleoside phosphorylase [Halobaculum magnesiiphilum]|uniref:Nucleoside phosphorylase n=1 Tax=Halobaculum magnesiiphilum TaxID=1017351 RepID=A0A8T8WFK6_9EURY|nr:nucleoside phosphorylase [Halobaculum magnesiiphilum]QZP38639.1 nucleoside phosphorylase [Halobaculum magnesiiphilum]
MTVPQFPTKHDHDPITGPDDDLTYYRDLNGEFDPLPESVVLTYSASTFDRVVSELGAEDGAIDAPGLASLHELAGTDGTVAVAGEFGIGAPATAMVVDVLAAAGVETVCIVGYAGALTTDLDTETAVVADSALRDEGTSYHYLPDGVPAEATPAVTDALETECRAADRPVAVGPTWSTDAAFRETAFEARQLAERGYLTVEMEAAALFAVAEVRGIDAGAAFAISDYVTPEGWERLFHEARDRLYDLIPVVRDAIR